jgi:hypothetical protein
LVTKRCSGMITGVGAFGRRSSCALQSCRCLRRPALATLTNRAWRLKVVRSLTSSRPRPTRKGRGQVGLVRGRLNLREPSSRLPSSGTSGGAIYVTLGRRLRRRTTAGPIGRRRRAASARATTVRASSRRREMRIAPPSWTAPSRSPATDPSRNGTPRTEFQRTPAAATASS